MHACVRNYLRWDEFRHMYVAKSEIHSHSKRPHDLAVFSVKWG